MQVSFVNEAPVLYLVYIYYYNMNRNQMVQLRDLPTVEPS
jgi:hypothetical protein